MSYNVQLTKFSRENNFDLVRLVAAFEVMLFHTFGRMQIDSSSFEWIRNFLGVPMFFTISGFLITCSYLNSKSLKQYFKNRVLRLYPALVCLWLLTVITMFITGDISWETLSIRNFWTWSILNLTVYQTYYSNLFTTFGYGVPNGSLWTIPVEISFYIFIPLVFCIFRKRSQIALWFLFILSIMSNCLWHTHEPTTAFEAIFQFTLPPYLYNFLIGTFLYLYWNKVESFLKGKFLYYLIPFLLCIFVFGWHPKNTLFYPTTFFMIILLSLMTISAAFTYLGARKILHGYDISYGTYIYHGLIINIFIEIGWCTSPWHCVLSMILSLIAGWLSWVLVEKKALKLKDVKCCRYFKLKSYGRTIK